MVQFPVYEHLKVRLKEEGVRAPADLVTTPEQHHQKLWGLFDAMITPHNTT
jgi:hypothetical protein